MATVQQINVKAKTPGEHGLPKMPVRGAFVTKEGVRGDYNVYRQEERHGDPNSALLIMPIETIEELNAEGWPVKAGDLGENFTTRGIDYSSFEVGKTFAVGSLRFQISRACDPCDNLFLLPFVGRSKGPEFLKVMQHRRGWYARVLQEGKVNAGDRITETGSDKTSEDL